MDTNRGSTSFVLPEIAALDQCVADAVVWRWQGQVHLTVIAKATFAFAPDADMTIVEPQPILRAEVHHGKNPARSVRRTSDLAPHLGRADVLFTGHAYAPAERTAKSVLLRLAVLTDERVILDKSLIARDERGFQRMAVVYERAFSGLDLRENPLGVDADSATLIDPKDPARPAGYGPIARAWPARKRLLGQTPRKQIEGSFIEVPEAFDWSYFQAAPLDQRIDYLRGNEWIVLEGLHATLARVRTRLPNLRGAARIHGLSAHGIAEGEPLDLHIDTISIDGDDETCTVICRASRVVPSEAALADAWIAVAIERSDARAAWPDPPRERREPSPPPAVEPPSGPLGTQLLIADEPSELVAPAPPEGTFVLAPEMEESVIRAPVLPFGAAMHAVPNPAPAAPLATFVLSSEEASDLARSPLRFAPSTPLGRVHAADAPIAGAPWSEAPAAHVPLPLSGISTLALFSDVPAPRAPEPSAESTEDETTATLPPPPMPPTASSPSVLHAPNEPLAAAESLDIKAYATVAAELVEKRAPRGEVLQARSLSEARWREIETHWTQALADEAARGERSLLDAHDEAYLAAWQALRGSFELADYARLTLATERGTLAPELDALSIRRTTWLRVKRVFGRRIATEPAFAARVKRALSEHRR